jgi:hypothetical protein
MLKDIIEIAVDFFTSPLTLVAFGLLILACA